MIKTYLTPAGNQLIVEINKNPPDCPICGYKHVIKIRPKWIKTLHSNYVGVDYTIEAAKQQIEILHDAIKILETGE